MNFECDSLSPRTQATKIPGPATPFKRSSSVRIRGEKANLSTSMPVESTIYEDGRPSSWKSNFPSFNNKIRTSSSSRSYLDDDLESIGSMASNMSVATTNSNCDHVNFAKNGTTFSGKTNKYIVHCSSDLNNKEEYLTPTQRANRNIKKLKSLLQLAREKLREKEEQIFRLNKEVVELKSFKAAVTESASSRQVGQDDFGSPDSPRTEDVSDVVSVVESSPGATSRPAFIKEAASPVPTPSQDFVPPNQGEKTCSTPDYLATASMADSGNFDDPPSSSASFHSRDFVSSDRRLGPGEGPSSPDDDRNKLVRMYERKLDEQRLEYEVELSRVVRTQEEGNVRMIREFEGKLKEEELKFEARWNELLKVTEEEKMSIVARFEEKLEEERRRYRENLDSFKAGGGKVTDMVFDTTYCRKVEEEKTIYETSLVDIKQKFEAEKMVIEKKFDDAIQAERAKFESSLKSIRQVSDSQVAELTKKVSELEEQYSELLPKYEQAVTESRSLEMENESLRESLKQQEESHKKMFLQIYKKGQEAANLEFENEGEEGPSKAAVRVSVPELFAQLKITEVELENLKDKEYRAAHSDSRGLCLLSSKEAISLWLLAARKAMYKRLAEAQAKTAKRETSESGRDAETTLQFLKSAVYYFLTDKENHLGHLKAIESILAFSSAEKSNIEKLYLNRY